eukprot:TRINITY_DN69603_c0_g1_i1.p2 TRINITY_DN69603_c0_g1~~TRINITY_DN69603_c0_g1_i1.p2  ORF type:complete len:108 (-),score=28.34 TRINITY_DN69603_c0_g1_i1:73-396(-)
MGSRRIFFFKQKTAYEMQRGLVGSEMCIRDSINAEYMGIQNQDSLITLTLSNTLKKYLQKGEVNPELLYFPRRKVFLDLWLLGYQLIKVQQKHKLFYNKQFLSLIHI